MELDIYQVDAFTGHVFGGNPAAVCPLDYWLTPELMQNIAAENNLAETAFFVHKTENKYDLRWFMPYDEIDLCGHATLASAHVIFNHLQPDIDTIEFDTQSGILLAQKSEEDIITLDFPSRLPKKIDIPTEVFSAFNHRPVEALANRDLTLLFENQEQIETLEYDLNYLKELPFLGIIATAKGNEVDFVSRVFDANCSMPEDPVTGSAHASLIPYWQQKLDKSAFIAHQLSERKGELICHISDDRVYIAGKSVLFLKGTIYLPEL